jgi:hypothetical protein
LAEVLGEECFSRSNLVAVFSTATVKAQLGLALGDSIGDLNVLVGTRGVESRLPLHTSALELSPLLQDTRRATFRL